jgi:excisionase family DNA binding protein
VTVVVGWRSERATDRRNLDDRVEFSAFVALSPDMTIDEVGQPRLLVTVREAAAMLALGRSTVYELIGAGELEVVHVRRAARIPVEALHEFVASRRGANGQA